MLAVVMCGGRGSRMAQPIEKSLLKLRNKTLIEYVLEALMGCGCFESIIAVPSVNTNIILQEELEYWKVKAKIIRSTCLMSLGKQNQP